MMVLADPLPCLLDTTFEVFRHQLLILSIPKCSFQSYMK